MRRAILESDYVLRLALSILDEVLTGRMRLEQAVEVSPGDPGMTGGLLRRIEANRRTLEHLLTRNQRDFRAVMNRRRPAACRQRARRRLARRRRRAAAGRRDRPADERLQPVYQNLCEMGKQMAALGEHLSRPGALPAPAHGGGKPAVDGRIARRASRPDADDVGNASRTSAPAGGIAN